MPVIKHIPSNSSTHLNRYLGSPKEVTDLPRVMYEWGQHCRPASASSEFHQLRSEHGQQGAMRRAPARYVKTEDPDFATHIKVGKNWREAREGETATAMRLEPETPEIKRTEAYHFIVSFAPDEVNLEDADQTQRAFDFTKEMWERDYPGIQSKLVAHGDASGSVMALERGEGGKFHVHIMANAVVHSEMELDGRTFKPGNRMAGPLTHVDRIRERHDAYLEERGREFGLEPQRLPAPRSKEARAVRRTDQDFFESQRGSMSDADRARLGIDTAMASLAEDPSALANLSESDRLERLAQVASATGDVGLKLRHTKTGEARLRSFTVPGRNQPFGGTRLGGDYTDKGLKEQLESAAAGTWKPRERPSAGPPREVPKMSDREFDDALRDINKDAISRMQVDIMTNLRDERDLLTEKIAQAPGGSATGYPRGEAEDRMEKWYLQGNLDDELQKLRDELEARQTASKSPTRPEVTSKADRTSEGRPATLEEKPETSTKVRAPEAEDESPARPKVPTPKKRRGPHEVRRLDGFDGLSQDSVDLIAVVRGERKDGGAYVDFQVAADSPQGRGQLGLYLKSTKSLRKNQDGSQREVDETWQQLTKDQYARLKLAAGSNVVDVDGKPVYAVAADVEQDGPGQYRPDLRTVQASGQPRIDDKVLKHQQASERRARDAHAEGRMGEVSQSHREKEARWKSAREGGVERGSSRSAEQDRGMGL